MSATCDTCRFWRRLHKAGVPERYGKCHWAPPIKASTRDAFDGFPLSNEDDFCRFHEKGSPPVHEPTKRPPFTKNRKTNQNDKGAPF